MGQRLDDWLRETGSPYWKVTWPITCSEPRLPRTSSLLYAQISENANTAPCFEGGISAKYEGVGRHVSTTPGTVMCPCWYLVSDWRWHSSVPNIRRGYSARAWFEWAFAPRQPECGSTANSRKEIGFEPDNIAVWGFNRSVNAYKWVEFEYEKIDESPWECQKSANTGKIPNIYPRFLRETLRGKVRSGPRKGWEGVWSGCSS